MTLSWTSRFEAEIGKEIVVAAPLAEDAQLPLLQIIRLVGRRNPLERRGVPGLVQEIFGEKRAGVEGGAEEDERAGCADHVWQN